MTEVRRDRGLAARASGRMAEWRAALYLMSKGYRILGFRLKTPVGEIDILAHRRNVLAVVEVKRRTTLEEALDCVSAEQRSRLRRAGRMIGASRPGLKTAYVRLDLIALAPGRWPRHIIDAWKGDSPGR